MKLKEFKQAMDWRRRVGFNGGGYVKKKDLPQPKPKEEAEKVNKARKEKTFKEAKGALENPKEVKKMIDKPKRGLVDEPGKYSQEQAKTRVKDPERLKALNAAAQELGYDNFDSIPITDRKKTNFGDREKAVQRATKRQAGVLPMSEAKLESAKKKFDLDFYKDKKTSELNKATKYYTKGKVTKFKDLVGPKYKTLRKTIANNLNRNKGKFRDPTVSTKDRFKKAYEDIKKFVKDFKKENKRLPTIKEIAAGTDYAAQGSIEAARDQGIIKTYEGIPPESAKAGGEKRGEIKKQKFTPDKIKQPVVRKENKLIKEIVYPDKEIDGKDYKQSLIEDIELRNKFPVGATKEAKAAGALTNKALAKKYKIKPGSFGSIIADITNFEDLTKKVVRTPQEKRDIAKKGRDVLKQIQGRTMLPEGLYGTKGTQTALQHALAKDPKKPITAKNLVFVPERANVSEIRVIEALRDDITKRRDRLLKNKPAGYVEKVNRLNTAGIEVAAKSDGLVQFESIDAKGRKFVYDVGSEKYQLDTAGLNENKLLKDYTTEDFDTLRLNVNEARKRGRNIDIQQIISRFPEINMETLDIKPNDTSADILKKVKSSPLPGKIKNVLLGTLGLTIGGAGAASAADGTEATSVLPTAVGAGAGAAAVGTKTGRSFLGKAFRTLGTPLSGLGFAGTNVYSKMKEGQSLADAVVDPITGLELSFPGLFKENLSKIISERAASAPGLKGAAAKFGRGLLGLGRIGRLMTPVGLTLAAAGQAQDFYNQYQNLQRMKRDDPEAYQQFRSTRVAPALSAAEQTAIEDMGRFGAAGGGIMKMAGKSSGRPPESGPTPQGLDFLLKRGR